MTLKWWQTNVIYQIYPRSFMDSDGDGIGDLTGVISKLDYLQWLGIDAIWFSPIYPSPMADFGYDVSDYCDIHPDFGTMTVFEQLLKEANERHIKIILDFVPSHTSDAHVWFQESKSSRDNPKRDWYIWKDPQSDGGPPNNWGSIFGGSSWTLDEHTGQYYLHTFVKEQPDLNWRNPEVKDAMFNHMRFWLDKGVHGFRLDAVDCCLKDAQFRDDPPNPNFDPQNDLPTTRLLRVHSLYLDEMHDLLREMRTVFNEYDDCVMIGEAHYDLDIQGIVRYYGETNDELMLPFNFHLIKYTRDGRSLNAKQIQAHVDKYDAAIGETYYPNWVIGNHDVPRVASRVGKEQARLYAMLTLTARGTPFIYYGEELGMMDVPISQNQVQDPYGINVPGQTRDPERTPMQWSAAANAGFSNEEATTWLPVATDYRDVNVEQAQKDPQSVLALYQKLLSLRRTHAALNQGTYFPIDQTSDQCVAYIRQHDQQQILVILNFGRTEQTVTLSEFHNGQVLLSTHLDREEEVNLASLSLRPYEGVLIRM